ncbi:AAA family ATPase [bacterium]|nr:AAA family ATPase [bacterium]
MLISFEVENWMSFRDKVTFSMVASREKRHGERIPRVGKYPLRILPIAAFFGGNASGKTNLFKALSFSKHLVTKGTNINSLIEIKPFRLDPAYNDKISSFRFELLIDEIVYCFYFELTRDRIIKEYLSMISSTREEHLYDRDGSEVVFSKSLLDNDSLKYAFKGTRDNQLFLTNSVNQKIDIFKPVFNWFDKSLLLIGPDDRFGPFEQFIQDNNPLFPFVNVNLARLDTGIDHLGAAEEFTLKSSDLPEKAVQSLEEKLKEGQSLSLPPFSNNRYIVTRKKGQLVVTKLVAFHKRKDGSEIQFETDQESDGSNRILDLLPAFLYLSEKDSKGVFFIDEIDRSLHTILVRRLIETYLGACSPESRSQLVFTTHDVLQMDQNLLRRDEMWVLERNLDGVSSLLALSDYKSDYKVRFDKDIRKMYLQGRFGGVPRLLLSGQLARCEKVGSSDRGEE